MDVSSVVAFLHRFIEGEYDVNMAKYDIDVSTDYCDVCEKNVL